MKKYSIFGERFDVICIEDHAQYIPTLANFKYLERYQAAQRRTNHTITVVWYGDSEKQYQVVTEGSFKRHFRRI